MKDEENKTENVVYVLWTPADWDDNRQIVSIHKTMRGAQEARYSNFCKISEEKVEP